MLAPRTTTKFYRVQQIASVVAEELDRIVVVTVYAFYYVGAKPYTLRAGGRLADIAPTILKLLDVPQPEEMTGKGLVG